MSDTDSENCEFPRSLQRGDNGRDACPIPQNLFFFKKKKQFGSLGQKTTGLTHVFDIQTWYIYIVCWAVTGLLHFAYKAKRFQAKVFEHMILFFFPLERGRGIQEGSGLFFLRI